MNGRSKARRTHVEQLHDHQDAEQRADDAGQDAPRDGGQDERQAEEHEALEREPRERARGETPGWIRSDQGDPHDDEGEKRERRGDAAGRVRAGRGRGGDAWPRRASVAAGAPQPPDVAAERLGEQGERDGEAAAMTVRGRTSAAAIVSTIPCVAATTLRQ